MAKKKPQKRGIITSRQRGKKAIEEARIRPVLREESSEEQVLAEGKVAELVEIQDVEIAESPEVKREKAIEKAQGLPEGVQKLFELTKENEPTPEEYRDFLVSSIEITGDDVYNAIKLGLEASNYNPLSKER